MKWIFTLLFLLSFNLLAVESAPAKLSMIPPSSTVFKSCSYSTLGNPAGYNLTLDACISLWRTTVPSWNIVTAGSMEYVGISGIDKQYRILLRRNVDGITGYAYFLIASASFSGVYVCPPDGKPTFSLGPVSLNGSQVCQVPPKVCMMGAIIRVASDGKETCVPNCSSASGLTHNSQYFFQAGPDPASTAGNIACYGQCSIKTIGGGIQLSSGSWTGNFTFTGANCPVVRPEPTVDSESNTSGNGDATPIDESTTSDGTESALGELGGAASSATGTQVEPSVTGPDGTATIKDVAQTIADAANAQIKATSAQNVAFGNLMSNISSDIQNATIKSGVGGGGASSSLQAQGNSKLGEISGKLGEISDKLDDETEELTFTPPNAANPFWENVLPQSSFDSISAQKDSAIEEFKELQQNFRQSLFTSDITASGEKPTFDLSFNSASFNAGSFIFDTISTAGIYSIIILIAMMTALYIIMNRSK